MFKDVEEGGVLVSAAIAVHSAVITPGWGSVMWREGGVLVLLFLSIPLLLPWGRGSSLIVLKFGCN